MSETKLMDLELSDLKPCPFCGNKKIVLENEMDPYEDTVAYLYMFCNECQAHGGSGQNEDQAKWLWNTRYA